MTDPAAGRTGTIDLELEPLDVLFFRDGRPFDAAARAAGGLPMPQTVAGALRTWLLGRVGCDFGALAAAIRNGVPFVAAASARGRGPAAVGRIHVRGPWFARRGERCVPTPATTRADVDEAKTLPRLERLVPTPATIEVDVDDPKKLYRLDPLADDLPGWQGADGLLPLWRRRPGAAKPRGGYLRPSGLARFLKGDVPLPCQVIDTDALFGYENRTGIGIDAARGAAGDGMIYSTRMMRLRPGVTLVVELVGSPEDLAVCPKQDDVLALGGEGRRVVVRRAHDVRKWPAPEADDGRGRIVLLTTPAPFGGWRPPGLPLAAAAVPGHVAVSGWDLARNGPKPNRFAVAAGSVYFLRENVRPDRRGGSLCAPDDAALGWGAYVEGAWEHV